MRSTSRPALTPWPPIDGRRIAGVSAFGFSGTNAHLIIEQAPPEPARAGSPGFERPVHLLTLSAKSDAALDALLADTARTLDAAAPETLPDLCYTANTGRSHFRHRIAVSRLQRLRNIRPPPGRRLRAR